MRRRPDSRSWYPATDLTVSAAIPFAAVLRNSVRALPGYNYHRTQRAEVMKP
jgi:hypothetical protein